MVQAALAVALVAAAMVHVAMGLHQSGPMCPVNPLYFPPLTCPEGFTCCDMPATLVCSDEAPPCTTCPYCCHSYLNTTECAACNAANCAGHSTVGDQGCNTTDSPTWVPWVASCCGRGMSKAPSTTLPNCLLIGDSTMAGQLDLVAAALKDECQVWWWWWWWCGECCRERWAR